jgi:hypothetical protein
LALRPLQAGIVTGIYPKKRNGVHWLLYRVIQRPARSSNLKTRALDCPRV